MLSNPWAKFYWLFVESRTPPGYWSMGCSSGSLQSRKRTHYMPQRPPCLQQGSSSELNPQATGLLGHPWKTGCPRAEPALLLFLWVISGGFFHLDACDSLLAMVSGDRKRQQESDVLASLTSTFDTLVQHATLAMSRLPKGQSDHSSFGLILNLPALNPYKLHPANAISMFSTVFCQHRSWDDSLQKKKFTRPSTA